VPALDGLRGIAILFVVWYHAPFLFGDLPEFSAEHTPWSMLGFFGRMSLGGWIGVDLFFVVSGFLITTILLRSQETGTWPWVFWGRRALRILPLAAAYLLTLFALHGMGDPLNLLSNFHGWSWYVMYLGNIHISLYGWQPLAVMILWSLAIEEQFYLVWPLIVRRVNTTLLIRWCIGLIVLAPLIRAGTYVTMDYPATYVFTFCRIDALAAGALVAALLISDEWRQRTIGACLQLVSPALVLILITIMVPFNPSLPQTRPWFFSVFGYSWLAAGFAMCLVASLGSTGLWSRILTLPLLTLLGRRCYGLYLWHVIVAGLVKVGLDSLHVGYLTHVLVWAVALLSVASASWYLFEAPILRLKRYIPYAATNSSQVVSSPDSSLQVEFGSGTLSVPDPFTPNRAQSH
jgi:peptidoglycan/LPS O-acetylase OafA/YrhL